jgi:hypothetical protein
MIQFGKIILDRVVIDLNIMYNKNININNEGKQ